MLILLVVGIFCISYLPASAVSPSRTIDDVRPPLGKHWEKYKYGSSASFGPNLGHFGPTKFNVRLINSHPSSAFDISNSLDDRDDEKFRSAVSASLAPSSTISSTVRTDKPVGFSSSIEEVSNVGKERSMTENGAKKSAYAKGKQKKAKALGRLLMNSVSDKNYVETQDDYFEDEDDDYSRGVNGEKMNWEDYQNEDGASVMELIALNVRHKTNMRRTHGEYLYRR